MSENSTRKQRPRKAAARLKKPYPDFPLMPDATGKWMKKIRGNSRLVDRLGPGAETHLSSVWDLKNPSGAVVFRPEL
jgi:hypothetical protein